MNNDDDRCKNIKPRDDFCYKVIDNPTKTNMSVETHSDPVNRTEKIVLNLKRNFEYLKAQRASIGISDISFG